MENRDIREQEIMDAVSAFEMMLREQINRNEKMRKGRKESPADTGLHEGKKIIGIAAGDGIGPVIMRETRKVLEKLLKQELAAGSVEFRDIQGFTLENRLACG